MLSQGTPNVNEPRNFELYVQLHKAQITISFTQLKLMSYAKKEKFIADGPIPDELLPKSFLSKISVSRLISLVYIRDELDSAKYRRSSPTDLLRKKSHKT